MKLYKHHYLSLGLILVGLISVGLSQVFYPLVLEGQAPAGSDDLLIGIIILLTGQVFGALNYIIEEKFLAEYDDLHPLIVVGWEGVWGSIIMAVMLVVLQLIPCSSTTLCSGGVIEDSIGALQEVGSSSPQIVYTILLLPLVCLYNTSGTSVTAYGSAAARCTIEQLRNLLVWIYFMAVKVNGIYIEQFTWLQLVGFIILLVGILIFNEIIILPVKQLQSDTRYSRFEKLRTLSLTRPQVKIPKINIHDVEESESIIAEEEELNGQAAGRSSNLAGSSISDDPKRQTASQINKSTGPKNGVKPTAEFKTRQTNI